jgi:hypothetical protein
MVDDGGFSAFRKLGRKLKLKNDREEQELFHGRWRRGFPRPVKALCVLNILFVNVL